jgi:hypothetical protein
MPEKMSVEEVATHAARYGVDARTIYRWRAAGVDVTDLEAVAAIILRQKRPSIKAMKNLEKLLP